MQSRAILAAVSIMLASSMAMAGPAPKAVDLGKLYGHFEKAGYSSLEFMEATRQVLFQV